VLTCLVVNMLNGRVRSVKRWLATAKSKKLDDPGVEPGTAPMLRENHTDRPDALSESVSISGG
jgi:hypothetical protein